jgi:hypothetical protein
MNFASFILAMLILSAPLAHPGSVHRAKPVADPDALLPIADTINKKPKALKVSADGHSLVTSDNKPFFYLGDTAWELFHRLTREEAFFYLEDRAKKGFTVIQAVALAELGGLTEPNVYGEFALKDGKPNQPNDKYFMNIDLIIDKAESLGLYVGLLPTWGDKWNKKWGSGPEIFTPDNARIYGEWLGQRYKDKPVIWILGGDRPIENDRHRAIMRAMAMGLRTGDQGQHLISYHPSGGISSSEWLHNETWLDFNMLQSSHARENNTNYLMIKSDYDKQPVKPVLDAEPNYENHPINWDTTNRYFNDYDVRKAAYWSLFAGAAGYTYGCHDIWQFYSIKHPAIAGARTNWKQALNLPGSFQMKYLRQLMTSFPVMMPDQSLILSDQGKEGDHIQACRNKATTSAMIYLPTGGLVRLAVYKLRDKNIKTSWFNPRTGITVPCLLKQIQDEMEFEAPTNGYDCDWVLILRA